MNIKVVNSSKGNRKAELMVIFRDLHHLCSAAGHRHLGPLAYELNYSESITSSLANTRASRVLVRRSTSNPSSRPTVNCLPTLIPEVDKSTPMRKHKGLAAQQFNIDLLNYITSLCLHQSPAIACLNNNKFMD